MMNSIEAFNPATKLDFSSNQQVSKEQNFVAELKMALDKISQTQIEASKQAKAFEMGEPNVSLNEVMVNMQKSSVSLQFGVQVRNKLVAAYQEIMNMNV
ncbi:flagellar hook-basal body complex protein FliE [Gilliamella sp. B3486]|nr:MULTISPECIES: flagellar hook-basal body complex protein FliE [Gilliamella]MCX8583702.1 flagellar hook-basal body complex protein FliE [Gilliamella sp. B3372]MCX8586286.1 flagellar hook-basal body complex protein FliE [Gilliamella sp. B3562]MCX8595089.1 flagellar hook-basal body complex protein FliE [Gilliamella sp. B3367]MCX8597417.1 flagellar hook-basal body complex protein FliE [Gilliamella sp. B3493]MCX8599800.1 flagellar hook-basal body complex protein FliE [Gilliamella sp. B3486]